jgi:molybdenum cofactor biosynthesis MoaF-like protein
MARLGMNSGPGPARMERGVLEEMLRSAPGAVLCLTLLGAVRPASSQSPDPGPGKMQHVGKSFVFDYGDLVIRVRHLSESRLEWEQVQGPQPGSKAEEQYGSSRVREDLVFFWWQEKDTSVVTQVVDFGGGVVHTTWTSPDKKLAGFQGKVIVANPTTASSPPIAGASPLSMLARDVVTSQCSRPVPALQADEAVVAVLVEDGQGGLIPGTMVSSSWTDGRTRQVVTDDRGAARIAGPSGRVRLRVELADFHSIAVDDLSPQPGCVVSVHVRLSPDLKGYCKGSEGRPCL